LIATITSPVLVDQKHIYWRYLVQQPARRWQNRSATHQKPLGYAAAADACRVKTTFALVTNHGLFALSRAVDLPEPMTHLPRPALPAVADSMRMASGDHEAIDSWIGARAGSELIATVYRREAMGLLLWLQYECQG